MVVLAALTVGWLTTSLSAGAYSPIAPVSSTSTTAGPTTTAAPNQGNNGGNGTAATTVPGGGANGNQPPAPSGHASTGVGTSPVATATTAKGSTLPFTGGDILGLVLLALLLLLIGFVARAAGRRRHA